VKGSGKTTLLDVLGRLVPRSLRTLNVTPAAVFRMIETYHPTILIDEADTFLYDAEGLRGVLDGNRKGDTVIRTVGDNFEPRAFATFCACVISLIGSLPDTLHDRSIVIDLRRRLLKEKITPFRLDRAGHLDVLARMAARWAQDNAERVAAADPAMPDGVINRESDNWRPLVAIADVAGGRWPRRASKAALKAHAAAMGDEASLLELLLGDIRSIFKERDKPDKPCAEIRSADLVEALLAIEVHPWAELGKERKPLSANKLARMLRPLSITSEKIGPEKKRVAGYVREHFKDAFSRYLEPEGDTKADIRTERDEMGTSGIFKADSLDPGCPDAKCENLITTGFCPDVRLQRGETAKRRMCGPQSRSPMTFPIAARRSMCRT
jgi:putative DNA primase/helicase